MNLQFKAVWEIHQFFTREKILYAVSLEVGGSYGGEGFESSFEEVFWALDC